MITVPMQVAVSQASVPVSASASGAEVSMRLGAEYNQTVIEASFPPGGYAGDLLAKRTNADYEVEWITPATSAEQDNTRPITAAAVYTEIGNINALLATI